MVELEGLPRKQQSTHIELAWNKGKPGGWEMYERLTDQISEEIEQTVDDPENYMEMVMKKVQRMETKIKFKAFGKTKPKSKSVVKGGIFKKTQSEQDSDLKRRGTEKIERHIEEIKTKNNGRPGNVFRIRKSY